jgi:hypothetical protein
MNGRSILFAALVAGVLSVATADSAAQGRKDVPVTERECAARHGEWVAAASPFIHPPPNPLPHECFLQPSDAGKPCHSSEECEGSCLVAGDPGGRKPSELSGACSSQYPLPGCHWYLEGLRTLQGCRD